MSPSTSAKALKGVWSGLAALVLLSALPVFGSIRIITVTNTNDSGSGSLRAAITSAAAGDTINFSLPLPTTITVSTPLTIGTSLTISGPGASVLEINGGDSVGVFVIQPLSGLGGPVTATISGLSIKHGSSLLGGGIYNGGTLTLAGSIVTNNTVGTQTGGGIFNAGTLTLTGSTVSLNSAIADPSHPFAHGGVFLTTPAWRP